MKPDYNTKKGRRIFLKFVAAGILAASGLAWARLTRVHIKMLDQKQKVLDLRNNKQVSFFENYIVVRQSGTITVLSSHCTHLGCRISGTENGRLVCPCHGSEYDLGGKVTKGPAFKNLEQVPFEITPDGEHIVITG